MKHKQNGVNGHVKNGYKNGYTNGHVYGLSKANGIHKNNNDDVKKVGGYKLLGWCLCLRLLCI